MASATTGRTPWQKPTLGGTALDSNLLGFHEGSVWYRAHFTAGTTRTLKLNANGAQGAPKPSGVDPASMQVWINGTYAGAYRAIGNTTSIELPSSVKAGDPVVLAVVVHNLGRTSTGPITGCRVSPAASIPPVCLRRGRSPGGFVVP